MDDVFAAGDLGEALKAVEAMEAAGLEAADARDKLMRVMIALEEVYCKQSLLKNIFDLFVFVDLHLL